MEFASKTNDFAWSLSLQKMVGGAFPLGGRGPDALLARIWTLWGSCSRPQTLPFYIETNTFRGEPTSENTLRRSQLRGSNYLLASIWTLLGSLTRQIFLIPWHLGSK